MGYLRIWITTSIGRGDLFSKFSSTDLGVLNIEDMIPPGFPLITTNLLFSVRKETSNPLSNLSIKVTNSPSLSRLLIDLRETPASLILLLLDLIWSRNGFLRKTQFGGCTHPPVLIQLGRVKSRKKEVILCFISKNGFNQLANCISMHMMDRSTLLAKILKATHCFNLLYFQRLMPWV